ncbi:ABC transporter ATP-binding protein [Candidatus Micrarchaeota archaeon]|nr:ABC transporter ATP-binding protein [Candidatus Micrarchaeota archaeon]
MEIVSVKKLSKTFTSGSDTVRALNSVDFSIKKGEVFGLLGPNGAGKTTLISIMCGFLTPDSGKAEMFGLDCTRESGKIRKRMNLASGFSGISDYFTAEELLYFFCMLYGLDNPKERVEKSLKLTGLEKYRKRRAADFSSGLGRRFLISKALINDPEVLLLDEPTVGLDVDSAAALRSMISELKNKGKTILLTTHNMKEAGELCDRIALIRNGSIIVCGTFSDLRKKFFPYEVLKIQSPDAEKLEKLLSKSVVRIKKTANSLKIYLKHPKDAAPLIKKIAASGIEIRSIYPVEPELEDLYTRVMRS